MLLKEAKNGQKRPMKTKFPEVIRKGQKEVRSGKIAKMPNVFTKMLPKKAERGPKRPKQETNGEENNDPKRG